MNFVLGIFSNTSAVALFVLGTVAIILGDTYAKLWSISKTAINANLSMLFYILGGIIFITIVGKTHTVGISNVIWNLLGIIGTLIISFFFFKETISVNQAVGIVLGIIAIVLITK